MSIRVYLIASTALTTRRNGGIERFLAEHSLKWKQQGSDAERLVEAAGRVCYMSFAKRKISSDRQKPTRGNADYIGNLISQGHDSVLEHANFTLLVDGLSRALSHQIVRHRIGFAYSQLSQQYHDESHAKFVKPALLASYPNILRMWKKHMATSRTTYRQMLEDAARDTSSLKLTAKERQRLARSIARSVLPNATATSLMVTGNARAWRHLLCVRGSIAGDLEMREYCIAVFKILRLKSPNLFRDFQLAEDPLGKFVSMCARAPSSIASPS
jgi:thymidylate synthase (FAD)